jgi:hypothetical protein
MRCLTEAPSDRPFGKNNANAGLAPAQRRRRSTTCLESYRSIGWSVENCSFEVRLGHFTGTRFSMADNSLSSEWNQQIGMRASTAGRHVRAVAQMVQTLAHDFAPSRAGSLVPAQRLQTLKDDISVLRAEGDHAR